MKLQTAPSAASSEFKTGFRAVSQEEFDDISMNGFRANPDGRSMEVKWFSESLAGAQAFTLRYPELKHVIEVSVPTTVYEAAFKQRNIDGTGPGFVIEKSDFKDIKIKTR
jgi:hypothetical protein